MPCADETAARVRLPVAGVCEEAVLLASALERAAASTPAGRLGLPADLQGEVFELGFRAGVFDADGLAGRSTGAWAVAALRRDLLGLPADATEAACAAAERFQAQLAADPAAAVAADIGGLRSLLERYDWVDCRGPRGGVAAVVQAPAGVLVLLTAAPAVGDTALICCTALSLR